MISLNKKLSSLERQTNIANKTIQEHDHLKFLGDLSLWVRDTHLKDLVNGITVKHKLTAITGRTQRRHDGKAERPRKHNPLDFVPGIVDYFNAGNDEDAMWMDDQDLRKLALHNFDVIAEEARPFYDVKLVLLQSAERNEQFHVSYPILRNEATTVESLGRFLHRAPEFMHALNPEDNYEVNRKLSALRSIYDELRPQQTDNLMEELFSLSRK